MNLELIHAYNSAEIFLILSKELPGSLLFSVRLNNTEQDEKRKESLEKPQIAELGE